jgi:hypothetical protein
MSFNSGMFSSGLGGLFGGLFGNSGKPYDAYQQWAEKAAQQQQPYTQAGAQGLNNYQEWLNSQKNPTEFINGLMGDYNESPYAQYQQKQSLRAGQNAASASGLSGSTPLMQQLQQNAGNISSQDQNQWLQNVLGINTQYGQGQQNLINGGQNAANSLGNIYNNQGEAAYGGQAGKQQDFWNTVGGGLGIFGSFL